MTPYLASNNPKESQPTKTSSQSSPISISDFQVVKLIGKGLGGQVFLAIDSRTNTPVALKVISKSKSLGEWVIQEQSIQASLNDGQVTFLLPLLCSWHDTENYYLVTEYLGGNDMAIELELSRRFSEDRVRFYAAELVVALEQLRARGIIHRDVKPGNIIFTEDGHIRLTDFGLSKKFYPATARPQYDESRSTLNVTEILGTPAYMSIEAHLGLPYSFDVDVHALGVLLYQMLTGKLPFGENAVTAQQLRDAIFLGSFHFEAIDGISEAAQDLVDKLLVKSPSDLISLEQMKNHPFFKGVKWDRVKKQTLVAPWKPFIPTLRASQAEPFITQGKPYKTLDPYPEFNFISPRLYRSKEVHRTGIFKKFETLFKSMSGKSAELPDTTSKALFKAVHNKQASPLTTSSSVFMSISAMPTIASTGSTSSSIPVDTRCFPNGILIIPPTATSLLDRPISTRAISTGSYRPLSHSKCNTRGRVPRQAIRELLQNRPHSPNIPRPPFINVFYSIDSVVQDLSSPPSLGGPELSLGRSAASKRKPPNSPIKRSPLRTVTNNSDRLSPSSVTVYSRRGASTGTAFFSEQKLDLRVKSENRRKTMTKPPPNFSKVTTLPNTIPTIHIPSRVSPTAPSSLPKLPPRSRSGSNVKLEPKVESQPTFQTSINPKIIPFTDMATTLDVNVKSTVPKVARGSGSITLDLNDDDEFFACRGDPELVDFFTTQDEAFAAESITSPPQLIERQATGIDDRKSQQQASTLSPILMDLGVYQNTSPPDFSNIVPGVYPRALERAEKYTHPALEFVDAKHKPADYPRPTFMKENSDLQHWYPSVEEAFALPPRTAPKPPKYPRRLLLPDLLFARAIVPGPPPASSRKFFDTGSPTLSDEARSRLYGHASPRLNLDGEEFKAHINSTITQARHDVFLQAKSGIFPSARHRASTVGSVPQPIASGPHYLASNSPAPPSGPLTILRRYYVRLLMACGRLLSRSTGAWSLNRI